MKRINKRTLLDLYKKPEPVVLTVTKSGSFRLSCGLFILLDNPDFVELLIADDGAIFICRSTQEDGFSVYQNTKTKSYSFSSKKLAESIFPGKQGKYIVFTEKVELPFESELIQAYQLGSIIKN